MKIVIHTESYAGNFERQLCAYITGQIGDCEVGRDIESPSKHLDWWESNIEQRDGDADYTCYRPCAIHPTPNWFNNGMGGHYRDLPENEAIALEENYQSTKDYHQRHIDQQLTSIENNDYSNGWTKEKREEDIVHGQQRIEQSRLKLNKWPAYLSVAIFVGSKPSDEIMDEVETLARKFASKPPSRYQKPFVVTSVELIED